MLTKASPVHRPNGFTIVELLVVIVVIAILAAISIVAFTGVQRQATEAATKAELNNYLKEFEVEQLSSGMGYTPNTSQKLFRESTVADAGYSYGTSQYYCVSARAKNNSAIAYHVITKDGDTTVKSGECPEPSFSTVYRCVAQRVVSIAKYRNDTTQNISTKASHGSTNDDGEPQQTVEPGKTTSAAYSLRVVSVPRGVITFLIYDTSGRLLETYYQASPALNCA